ncbi:phosphodiester glycosidase family protein [Alicyclobacillus dauci]|uniref:Phosphodiester glycosidase family protein n=1 Tax=Alicyclobacillus dauci TaxID=1475485 RepID=A0ABY6Z451_9BACL|nr:phosphodiester glycosidase family protein [Alicyclobacillus dauci]WAH37636.1 phosphodiester glycosidase family protein [Alicyclobacillus dauci]
MPRKTGRLFKWGAWGAVGAAYIAISSSLWIFHGPFPNLKSYVVDTVDETRHGYLLKPLSLFTLPESVIQAHALSNNLISVTKPVDQIQNMNFVNRDGSIKPEKYKGSTFSAYILLVSDPNRIKVITTKYMGQHGETVQAMVKDVGAVAGINGGSFNDENWKGTGGDPEGVTMHNGKLITNIGAQTVIAFRKGGQMIAGDYTVAQLRKLDVQEAVSFGPVIVQDGKPVWVPDKGYDIRTAIGQEADGTVILMVTTGRGIGGPGASLSQVADVMIKYHAVIAANLDGGSSTQMVNNSKLVNTPWDIVGARSVGTSVVVMPGN